MNTSKVAIVVSAIFGKVRSIIGYVLGGISLIVMISVATDDYARSKVSTIIFFTVVLILSILLVISGAKAKRRIKRFKRYVSMISNENIITLGDIASATAQSVDFVKNDLQDMIDKKFFANAFIDVQTGEIVIGNRTQTTTATNVKMQQNANTEIENVKCSGCGAVIPKPKGMFGNCDYCGTLLK